MAVRNFEASAEAAPAWTNVSEISLSPVTVPQTKTPGFSVLTRENPPDSANPHSFKEIPSFSAIGTEILLWTLTGGQNHKVVGILQDGPVLVDVTNRKAAVVRSDGMHPRPHEPDALFLLRTLLVPVAAFFETAHIHVIDGGIDAGAADILRQHRFLEREHAADGGAKNPAEA